jgi:hypothetical protein
VSDNIQREPYNMILVKLSDLKRLGVARLAKSESTDSVLAIQHAAFVFELEILCSLQDWSKVESLIEVPLTKLHLPDHSQSSFYRACRHMTLNSILTNLQRIFWCEFSSTQLIRLIDFHQWTMKGCPTNGELKSA